MTPDVPASIDDLATQYDAFIRTQVHRACGRKCRIPVEERRDICQLVYVKLIERNFLARCRTFLAAHPDKHFRQSLATFVSNLTSNYLRDRGRRVGRFRQASPSEVVGRGAVDERSEWARVPAMESHEDRILARQYLGEIAGFLMDEPEMLAVIRSALAAGGELSSGVIHLRKHGRVLDDTTVRRYIRRLKARVREVAA